MSDISRPRVRLSITLSDGTTESWTVAKTPRHWKSWVMQRMPYGTDFFGCTFSRTLES